MPRHSRRSARHPSTAPLPFIPLDLAFATEATSAKNGYYYTVEETGTGTIVVPGDETCNNADSPSPTEYLAGSAPSRPGVTGLRYFATNQTGEIRQHDQAFTTFSDGGSLQN